ncbi:MAG: TetR family transcriptional regulator C-terminal domain-containing protein [Elusimicrobia bacterium]|nr:TetR family transcriptional regulator C-terminal domain-containing protein [Elusimicrobiota bacterium]
MRQKIIDTAVSLFHQFGFKGVSVDDIATKAGVKKANLFHYYPSKEDLGLAAVCQGASCQEEAYLSYFSPERDPIEAVEAMFDDAASSMKKEGCKRGCFIGNLAQEISNQSEKLRRKILECFGGWTNTLAEFLESWKNRGYFRKDFEPKVSAQAIIHSFEGAMLCCKASRDVAPLHNSKKFVVLYLRGYKA